MARDFGQPVSVENLGLSLRLVAEQLARQAGDFALAGRKNSTVIADTKSSPTDMVTQFDRASEEMITSGLNELRPHDSIIGEEGATKTGTSDITWHIDPIDGTSNFYFDIPMWAVSIGATDKDGPLAGAVYAPALGEMFTAARGHGATCNGKTIQCRDNATLTDALVCTGYSYRVEERAAHALRVARMVTQIRDIRRFGAAAIDLCFVASGRYDAYFEEHLHSWDLIAGQIIATEAGALVTNYQGGQVSPREVLGASPAIQKDLINLIARCTTEN